MAIKDEIIKYLRHVGDDYYEEERLVQGRVLRNQNY